MMLMPLKKVTNLTLLKACVVRYLVFLTYAKMAEGIVLSFPKGIVETVIFGHNDALLYCWPLI